MLLAAGCGATGCTQMAGEEQLAQKSPRSVPLTLWARSLSDKSVFDAIAPLVEQRYPRLAVTTEVVSGLENKIVVALAGGGVPDLAVVSTQFATPMIGQQAFVNLQPYLAKDRAVDQELKSFAPAGIETYRFKNDLYAIPITSEAMVLWYNEDLFRRANLVPPHEIENDPQKWNWDTMLDFARKLNRGRDQDRETFGLWIGSLSPARSWANLVYANGGRVLSENGSKMVLSQVTAAEAMQWSVDTIWRHDVAPQPATLKTTSHQVLFTTGRLAMVMDGEFLRRNLFGARAPQGVPFKFNLAQNPFAPRTKKRATVLNALGLPIVRGAKLPEAAWEYVRVFVTKDAQQFITDEWGSRGGNQKTYDSWLRSNAGGGPPANYAAITRSDSHGWPNPASPYLAANELFEPMNRLIPQMFANTLPVRTGLQQIDQETNAKLEPAARAAAVKR